MGWGSFWDGYFNGETNTSQLNLLNSGQQKLLGDSIAGMSGIQGQMNGLSGQAKGLYGLIANTNNTIDPYEKFDQNIGNPMTAQLGGTLDKINSKYGSGGKYFSSANALAKQKAAVDMASNIGQMRQSALNQSNQNKFAFANQQMGAAQGLAGLSGQYGNMYNNSLSANLGTKQFENLVDKKQSAFDLTLKGLGGASIIGSMAAGGV